MPGHPVAKGRPRAVTATRKRIARLYTPKKTEDYENLIKLFASPVIMTGQPLLDGPICLDLVLYFQIPTSWTKVRKERAVNDLERPTVTPDVDNCLKIWGDALNGLVWHDDKQIVEAKVTKFYSHDPRAQATISRIVNKTTD